jgi:hypothetical protein
MKADGVDVGITVESIETQIPYYLTQKAKENLVQALKNFPEYFDYYTDLYPTDVLQGDGWSKLEVLRFEDGARKEIKGIVLSNSCDISVINLRDFPPNISFAPIIKLSKYAEKLAAKGFPQEKIESRLQSIRVQQTSNMFFLPKGGKLDDDFVALLGDLHTMPFKVFEPKGEREKQFTLSQVGFYLFLLKLSVHFCRFHEEIER